MLETRRHRPPSNSSGSSSPAGSSARGGRQKYSMVLLLARLGASGCPLRAPLQREPQPSHCPPKGRVRPVAPALGCCDG